MEKLILKIPEGNVELRENSTCDFCLQGPQQCISPVRPITYTTLEATGQVDRVTIAEGYPERYQPFIGPLHFKIDGYHRANIQTNQEVTKTRRVDICQNCVKQLGAMFKDIHSQ